MNKIDLIIDALSVAQSSVWSALNQEALAYAIELKLELAEPRIPAKIIGPNLEEILNAAGFYRGDAVCCNDYEKCIKPCTPKGRWLAEKELRKEWVGLTEDDIKGILDCGRGGLVDIKKAEQILRDKNT